jgi:hypothetical protein
MKQGFGWLPTRDYPSAIVATFELLKLPLFMAPEKAREGFEHEEAPKLENGKSVAVGRREIPIHLVVRNFRCRRPRPISISGD